MTLILTDGGYLTLIVTSIGASKSVNELAEFSSKAT
jgi:hypothetical protein